MSTTQFEKLKKKIVLSQIDSYIHSRIRWVKMSPKVDTYVKILKLGKVGEVGYPIK